MPNTKKNKSPYATTFKSAINRGTPCFVAVQNIAKRTKKSPNQIFESLFKSGLCFRQKIAGQWVYWPCQFPKTNATNAKVCQNHMWQWFVDWCLTTGVCTAEQLHNHCGSQVDFMNYCKKFWSKQFTTGSKTTTKSRKSVSGNYKFPTAKSRKYRKVA